MNGLHHGPELRDFVAGLVEAADAIADHSCDSEALDSVPCGVLHELNDADNELRELAAFLESHDAADYLARRIERAWRLIGLGYGFQPDRQAEFDLT